MTDPFVEIEATHIDEEAIRAFRFEGDFVGTALDLLIEAGSYVCVAANLYRNEETIWSRDEAALGGHLVRLYKLIDATLDQTCKHRRETSMIFARLIFECIVNFRYLVANASERVFRSYRLYSLQHELRLLERIEANIVERNAEPLPIETRMIRSIEMSFAASSATREQVAAEKQRNWDGLNLYERARLLGLDQAYLAAFGGGSHAIHGNWQDMLEYHLEKVEIDQYRANIEWHNPRPQILQTLVILTADALVDYLEYLDAFDEGLVRLRDLQDRTRRHSELHEDFLVASGNTDVPRPNY